MKQLPATSVMFWLIALLSPLTACATTLSSEPIQGQVLEEGTNKPILGAIVVVLWKGTIGTIGHGRTICYHVETATTDNQGSYQTQAWKKPSPYGDIANRHWVPAAYKSGYESVRYGYKGTVHLKPFVGTREERLKVIRTASVGCGSAGESEKNLLPLYRVLHEQAQQLAVTKQDRLIVNALLHEIDMIELPYADVLKRDDERYKALHREFPNE